MMSSTTPSAKYSCSASPLISRNGRTAIGEGLSGTERHLGRTRGRDCCFECHWNLPIQRSPLHVNACMGRSMFFRERLPRSSNAALNWPVTASWTVRARNIAPLRRVGAGAAYTSNSFDVDVGVGPGRREEQMDGGLPLPPAPATTVGGGLEIGWGHRECGHGRLLHCRPRPERRQRRQLDGGGLPAGVAARADRVVPSLPGQSGLRQR